jgi:DNA polymerase (family 10)
VEIRADGVLDYPDEVLASLDIVVASLHTSLRQPRERVTERMLAAVRNPHVDIIGHPTGRLIPSREGADLDIEAVLAAARQSGVALEVNANPERLDLEDKLVRRALTLGCTLAINTDAHSPSNFDLAEYGIATARRGWATAESAINAWPVDRLEAWLKRRGAGQAAAVEPSAAAPKPARAPAKRSAPKTAAKPKPKPAAKPKLPARPKAAAQPKPAPAARRQKKK